ncbi:MAG: TAXI family TRAP transporter solute-binding subunit [Defluviitaleaceae bacterium]|nr:TAXI family TRAP transporter solute-binding subunit [Defluviitaleaceae bacterium]
MKNLLASVTALLFILALAACSTPPTPASAPLPPVAGTTDPADARDATPAEPEGTAPGTRFVLSTSNPGGLWYQMGGGLGTLWNQELAWPLDQTASAGAVENTRRAMMGDTDFFWTHAHHIHEAITATGAMSGLPPTDSLRMIHAAYESSYYIVVLYDSGIRTMSDLEGRSVVIGPPGGGVADNSRRFLSALGITVNESEMSHSDGARALQDGLVEAVAQHGHPVAAITELATLRDIWVIPFSDEEMDAIRALHPYFFPNVIEADTYRGQNMDVQVPFWYVWFAASEDTPEDVVYEALTAIFSDDGMEFLTTVHPHFAESSMGEQAANDAGFVFHPGAIRFFDENPQFR